MIATSVSPTTRAAGQHLLLARARDRPGRQRRVSGTSARRSSKTFDKGPPSGPVPDTSIKNLHMRDNLTDDTTTADTDHDLSNGYSTRAPVVAWDPVPGASSYEVQVARLVRLGLPVGYVRLHQATGGSRVDAARRHRRQSGGVGRHARRRRLHRPHTRARTASACARESDRATRQRRGLGRLHLPPGRRHRLGPRPSARAFNWSDYPDPSDPGNSLGCNTSYLCADDYLLPQTGLGQPAHAVLHVEAGRRCPELLRRRRQGPELRRRSSTRRSPGSRPTHRGTSSGRRRTPTRRRSTTGRSCPVDHLRRHSAPTLSAGLGAPQDFQKQSLPPTLVYPSAVQVFPDQPRFQWTATEGARRYHLQVASDSSFSNLLDDIVTDSTAYTSNTTYPANTVLYWRVRADDENKFGLDLVGGRNLPEDARQADAEPDQPDLGRHAPRLVVVAGAGRVVLRRLGRPPERQPP